VFEYVGPAQDPDTMGGVRALLDKFQAQALEEFRRRARKLGAEASSV